MKLILASASPRRKAILHKYGLSFVIMIAKGEEKVSSTVPSEVVLELSKQKAYEIHEQLQKDGEQDYAVIGADTVVACNGEILGKPKDKADALRMIGMLQNGIHQVYTGVTLILYSDNEWKETTFFEKTDVFVRAISREQIEEYVATGECDDKAGAYAIQGKFSKYIDHIEGDYYNVVGMPGYRVIKELYRLGYPIDKKILDEVPVRLVVSDIDGTLVKDSAPEIYDEMLEAIRELRKRGILFCIASGRQYESIRSMFAEVADDMIYLCENGAHLVYQNQNLHIKEMKPDLVSGILADLRTYKPECDYVISTPQGSYLESPDPSFEILIRDSYHNRYQITEDFLKEEIPAIKLALYKKGNIRPIGEQELIPKWQQFCKTCMAGEEWVDFMDKTVDKGNAMEFLQNYFSVTKEETMVFGDNSNDIGLMQAAKESYAVENARPEVMEKAKYTCPPYWEKGVYQVIKERLLDEI